MYVCLLFDENCSWMSGLFCFQEQAGEAQEDFGVKLKGLVLILILFYFSITALPVCSYLTFHTDQIL